MSFLLRHFDLGKSIFNVGDYVVKKRRGCIAQKHLAFLLATFLCSLMGENLTHSRDCSHHISWSTMISMT